MTRLGLMLVVGATLTAPGVALAQQETLTAQPASVVEAGGWRPFSRNSGSVYLADMGSMSDAADARVIRMARVPRAADDRSHAIEVYQFRCGANQWRVVRTEEFGNDGARVDAWDEADATWLDVPAETNMAYLKRVVCDQVVPAGRAWPRLEDYLASDRS